MGAYLESLESTIWSDRAQEIQGADPGQLPGRKLVAEACLVDLLAPMFADTSSIPEHLDLMARAGWCGWLAGRPEGSSAVSPPDERTVSRYATELRTLTANVLPELLRDLMLRLFRERALVRVERPLNATCVKRLLSDRVPWIHRELVNGLMAELAEEGWFLSTSRGYRLAPEARERAVPLLSPEGSLAGIFQDVYPALTAYVDLQPGAIAGLGVLIATPDRLELLGQTLDEALEGAVSRFLARGVVAPPERRTVLHLNRMLGPSDEPLRSARPGGRGKGLFPVDREDGNAELRALGPLVAVSALPGWGDPDEAWRGLKGAVASHLQRLCKDLPGGLFRAAHRAHGIGSGTLNSYFDGPVLVSRNNGKIRAVREGEASRLERETLYLLSQVFPEPRSERWIWEQLAEQTEVFSFQEYRYLLLKLARDGFVLMSRSGAARYYRAPMSYQAKPALRMWDRWQKLWRWLPTLRSVARAVRHGCPGATVGRGRWMVDREDLPEIEAQIQSVVDETLRNEAKRCAHLEEVDHFAMGGKRSNLIIFTRQEPWLLAQMEDLWEETR